MEEIIDIEKEDSLFFEKLNQKLFKSRPIHGEVNIAMELGFQEPVVHIGDRITLIVVFVGAQNVVGASGIYIG